VRPGSHDVRRRKRAGRAPCRGVRLDTQGAGPDEIVAAVRVVARGEALFGAGIAARMLQHFGRAATSSPFPELTERETEVLGLLAAGPGQRWGRDALGVSPKTVHNHVSNIITKLHVSDRSGAIFRARDVGLGGTGVGLNYPCPLGVKKLECHHR
jgi:DNA-binding NarL/FixJ family response regulator